MSPASMLVRRVAPRRADTFRRQTEASPEMITEPSTALLAVFVGVVVVSALAHGAIGFGFPVLSTPVFAALTDVRTAILLTLIPTIVVNLTSIIGEGRWDNTALRQWPLAVYAAVGSVLGTTMLIRLDPEPFRLVLAAMIFLYLYLQQHPGFRLGFTGAYPKSSMLAFGLTAGVMAGTVNTMVPVLIVYVLELGLATSATVQLFNLCFMAGKLSQVGTFGIAGIIGEKLLYLWLILAVPSAFALLMGRSIRKKIDGDAYRDVLKWMLGALATLLIVQFFT